MKVLVYFSQKYLSPKGGAGAVCYYYNEEQKRRCDSNFEFLPVPISGTSKATGVLKLFSKIKNYFTVLRQMYLKPATSGRDLSKYDIIHFHDTNSLYYAQTDLKNYKGVVLLQSHSPQPLAEEQNEKLSWQLKLLFPLAKKRFEAMDKFAFERADYFVFPCPDAEEPYIKALTYFKQMHENRPESFKYVLTGIPKAKAKRTREEVCNELNIPIPDFIITYVGRHNSIKGFDLLKEIGQSLLAENKDMWIISAGKEEPIKRLEHSQWKEIGWTTDAHSYINAADVFILPNRETYFDIVMLEVLSLGKIVVASATGGNKFFERNNCEGVFLYHSKEECVQIIQHISKLNLEERNRLGEANQAFFNENLTVSTMYDSYINLLSSLSTK